MLLVGRGDELFVIVARRADGGLLPNQNALFG